MTENLWLPFLLTWFHRNTCIDFCGVESGPHYRSVIAAAFDNCMTPRTWWWWWWWPECTQHWWQRGSYDCYYNKYISLVQELLSLLILEAWCLNEPQRTKDYIAVVGEISMAEGVGGRIKLWFLSSFFFLYKHCDCSLICVYPIVTYLCIYLFNKDARNDQNNILYVCVCVYTCSAVSLCDRSSCLCLLQWFSLNSKEMIK